MNRLEFTSYVKETQKAFRRFLCALCCGDSQLADDIAQESYIKAYLSWESLKNPERFKTWIFRIGYTTFINHKRSQILFSDYSEAQNLTVSESPEDSFKYQALYDALGQLNNKERMAVLLFYMEGYSIKEISEIVEASQDAVKQYLSRGRTHLKTLLLNQ